MAAGEFVDPMFNHLAVQRVTTGHQEDLSFGESYVLPETRRTLQARWVDPHLVVSGDTIVFDERGPLASAEVLREVVDRLARIAYAAGARPGESGTWMVDTIRRLEDKATSASASAGMPVAMVDLVRAVASARKGDAATANARMGGGSANAMLKLAAETIRELASLRDPLRPETAAGKAEYTQGCVAAPADLEYAEKNRGIFHAVASQTTRQIAETEDARFREVLQKTPCDVSAYRDAARDHGLATHGATPELVRDRKARRRAERATGPRPDIAIGTRVTSPAMSGVWTVAALEIGGSPSCWTVALKGEGVNAETRLYLSPTIYAEKTTPVETSAPRPPFASRGIGTDPVPYPDPLLD